MGLFKLFSKKRAAAIGFQPQKSVQKTSLQTFILEPILTPSGLLDGGDSAPDPVVMDWNMDTLPDVDLPDMDVDADAADTLANVDLPDADEGADASDTFAPNNYQVEIPDADIEPVDFFYGNKDDSLGAIAESSSIASVDLLDIDADTDASVDVDLADIDVIGVIGADADTEIPDDGTEPVDVIYDNTNNLVTDVIQPSPTFNSGVFTVGDTGEVSIDFLFDGGQYQGELAVFSLDGMDGFEPGSEAFIKEAASRALSNSELGHIALSDTTEGARFSGTLPHEGNFNTGGYQGVKTFSMRPGDTFGVMLVPHGTVQQLFDNPAAEGYGRPLFSMTTSKPTDLFHMGQIADVTGDGNTFVMEDMGVDGWTDKDYNDVIFQVRGATGKAALLDDVIDSGKDWRSTDMGEALIAYAKPYITPDAVDDGGALAVDTIPDFENTGDDGDAIAIDLIADNEDITENPADDTDVVEEHTHAEEVPVTNTVQPQPFEFAKENQPLVGVIDTGFSANNPDIDYSRIILGQDRVNGDANPLLSAGEGNEHGTHVLGIIGATQDNDIGIDGINDDAPLWVGRAVGSGKWADSLVEFVDAAKESGQPNAVVNLSLDLTQINPDGSVTTRYEFTPAERAAIEYARQHNVLIVAAAGNDGGVMSVLGQASQEFDNIITVGAAERVNDEVALTKAFDRAAYSSYGNGLDIMAPGGTVENPELSTTGDGVGTMAGTSVASAKVTGAVSQVWAANPGLSYRQVIEILKNTATDLKTPGWDGETGAGLLNMAAAVHLAKATQPEKYDAPATIVPETWSGEGRATASERAAQVWSTNFTARVMANSANVRSGPGTGYSIVGSRSHNNYVNFDGWTYGERITDIALGTPDERWYRIAGTNQWIASAIVDGDAPGSTPLPPAQPQPQPQPNLNNTVGYDGTSTHQTYINTFNRNGGSYALGSPSNNAHPWGDGYTQDFSGGSGGTGAIMKSNANDNSYWVGGDFWNTFLQFNSVNGLLKYPTSDRYGTNGGQRQDFQGSAILKSGRGIFPVYGGIGSHYLNNESGQNGRLGFPTSGEIGIGNGVIVQNFENGRIVYGDGPTRTEMNSQPQPTTPDWQKAIENEWQQTKHLLGNPTSDYKDATRSPQGTSGKYRDYENGTIHWTSQHGAVAVWHDLQREYNQYNFPSGSEGWLGFPTKREYAWNGGMRTDFEGGYIFWNGQRAKAYRSWESPNSPTSVTIGGYTVSGNFYPVFKNYQGTLGNPTSGVTNHSNGATYQLFQSGSIVSSKHGTFPLYGGIRQTYLKNNGLNGWLGAPTSAEVPQGNGFIKQTFEGGYIVWYGGTATAYRTGSGTPSQPAPNPQPTNPIPSQPGNGQRIIDAVNRVNPDQWYYSARDITGDGFNETFCNWFVADVLECLGVPIRRHNGLMYPPVFNKAPRNKPVSANDLYNFLNGGGGGKWKKVSAVDAVAKANNGEVIVASWYNPKPRASGHIAIVIPGGSGSGVRIAQAGQVNGKNMTVEAGFRLVPSFFAYIG